MNILIISALDIWSVMGPGKGSPVFHRIVKAYTDRGHRVYLLTSARWNEKKDSIHKNISITRFSVPLPEELVNIRKIGFIFRSIWWCLYQIIAYYKANNLCEKYKIDIFYGHEIYGVPVAFRLANKYKKPMISRFKGTILKPKIGKRLWKIRFWEHIKALRTPADLVIMTNDGTQGDKVLETLGVDMNKVKFWMNGVDINKTQASFDIRAFRNQLGISEHEKILLTVTRLMRWKRVDRIINAMPNIIANYKNVKLLIAGDGRERIFLEELVKSLNLQDYVRFLGSIPNNEIWKYFNIADIFVLLNDLSNLSNPLLEGMSCGRCVITLNIGGIREIIKDGENGILLEYNKLNTLPSRIVEVLKSDEIRNSLGRNARNTAERHFDTWKQRTDREVTTVENLNLR